ncbi:L-2-hydroxyglutarate oxidase OS=Streptomyces albaduncus OX=68172 GN=FHS32_004622 PE=3 SV=1 [Streptomyces griseoloalbus]
MPFRGEYYELARPELVRGLVYPVPDPAFPFLGVHLTRGMDGGVHVGPNAVPALAREGYGWRACGRGRLGRRPGVARGVADGAAALAVRGPGAASVVVQAGVRGAVRRLLPAVEEGDLVPAAAGVRAQAVLRDGGLVDDFLIREEAPLRAVMC